MVPVMRDTLTLIYIKMRQKTRICVCKKVFPVAGENGDLMNNGYHDAHEVSIRKSVVLM